MICLVVGRVNVKMASANVLMVSSVTIVKIMEPRAVTVSVSMEIVLNQSSVFVTLDFPATFVK